MKDNVKIINNNLKNRIGAKYYDAYFELMQMYENSVNYLKNNDKEAFDAYYSWLMNEGENIFDTITNKLIKEKLDDRFNAFMDIYKTYLEEAVEENCKQIVLEFLYRIPRRMKEDFNNFGFLEDNRLITSQEYVYVVNINDNNINDLYYYHWKPGIPCQVSLF